MRRRDLLVIGGLMAAAVSVPPILRRLPSDFEFEPLPGFDGFRRLQGGATSGVIDPFFGLGERLTDQASVEETPPQNPCTALFGAQGGQPGEVPVAFFTDANCPYCKVLEKRLVALRDSGAPITLVWHEFPLLGASSVRTARAMLAARFLGVEDAARAYLSQKALPPGPVGLRRFAEALNVPPDAMLREEQSARVSKTLSESMHLGRRLGIFGTPGTVIGRTLVIGAIRDPDLIKLIEIEASEPQTICP
jgi:2-hydroxychromene-2-carboxylate isomerase